MIPQKLEQLIEPALADLGFECVRIRYTGGGGKSARGQLQIMAEPTDLREMTVEDCATISRHLSAVLDVEDPIADAYQLEISSPGMDRPLTRLKDFSRFSGELVKITLKQMLEGQKRYRGRLVGVDDEGVIHVETLTGRVSATLDQIDTAKIDPTEFFPLKNSLQERQSKQALIKKRLRSMDTSSIPGLELLQIADVVAREKSIEREEVIAAMEEAIQKAGRSKYGHDRDIRAMIDRKSGSIQLERWTEVVEEVENDATQMGLEEGRKHNLEAGDFLKQPLPPIEFGRIAAQTAKQVISQKVREAERARQYQEYKDRVGEIVLGTVKRAESYSVTIDLGRAEGVMRREEMIPRENLNQGDRVRAYIVDVREEVRGPQIFLSRSANEFMAKLFTQEVPEIYDGIIEIKAVAREPGSRAKISVLSRDQSIDPVGACVGLRGSRVQAVVSELQGEKIEIIPFSDDPVTFIVNALAPAEVAKVVVDEVAGRVEVVVPDEQLSLAIGRRGQNVRLASQLTGWYIDILTEAEESERRQEEFKTRSARFIEALNIDDVIAHLLVAEGFVSIDDIVATPVSELAMIQGFDEDIAGELLNRAVEFSEAEAKRITEELEKLNVQDDLRDAEYLSLAMILTLAENKILCLDDLAELDSEELLELLGEHGIEDEAAAGDIIMAARAHWFADEDAEAEETAAADSGDDAQ